MHARSAPAQLPTHTPPLPRRESTLIVGGIDPAGIVMVVLLYAIPIALGLFALYWIVRKAVCAGIRDARRDGTE